MTGCKSGKRRINSLEEAQHVLAEIKRKPKKKMPKRIYLCHLCSGWHLTSQEQPEREAKSVFLRHFNDFKKYLIKE